MAIASIESQNENKMKTKYYILTIAAVGTFCMAAAYYQDYKVQKTPTFSTPIEIKQNIPTKQMPDSDTIPSDWNTYANNELGISFQIPPTWIKYGNESNAINRNGEVVSISVNLIDTTTQSFFSLTYSLPPYGPEVYKIEEDQYNSYKSSSETDMKRNIIAGNNAIETFSVMRKDIKGKLYDPALRLVHIVFLDKQKTGAFNLNFRTPEPGSKKELAKFDLIISTIRFN